MIEKKKLNLRQFSVDLFRYVETAVYHLFHLIIMCFIYYYGLFLSSPSASDLEMQYLCLHFFAVKSLKLMVLSNRLGKI